MHNYTDSLSRALMTFQCIEEALKMYICYADTNIQRKDVANNSLVKLTKKYTLASNNISLAKKIQDLSKRRNEIAHEGFLFTFEEQKNEKLLKKLTAKIDKTYYDANEALKKLMQELSKVRV